LSVSAGFRTGSDKYQQVFAILSGPSTLGAGGGAGSLKELAGSVQKDAGSFTYRLVTAIQASSGALEAMDGGAHLEFVSILPDFGGK
jgi:hypothetical protein